MTITIRIQYKGDAARKLAADEYTENARHSYKEDMARALGLFAIPPPEDSRAIWKSGFILCHYNIHRETPLYDRIYRGAFRAQSIACRKTLDGLSISYIHLFENGKQIHLVPRVHRRSASPQAHPDHDRQHAGGQHTGPQYKHKTWTRPLGPERSLPELSSRPYMGEPSNRFQPRPHSLERGMDIDVKPSREELDRADRAARGQNEPDLTANAQDALKRLAESETFLALLGQGLAQGAAPPIKQEMQSPTQLGQSGTSQPMFSGSSSRPPFAGHPSDSRLVHHPPYRPSDPSSGRPLQGQSSFDPSLTPRMRRISLNDSMGPDERGRPVEPPYRRRTPSFDLPYGPDRRPYAHDSNYREFQERDPNGAYYKRHSYGEKQPYQTNWNRGYKRPLSPTQSSRRSVTPPAKRRYSMTDNPNGSFASRIGDYAQPQPRPSGSGPGYVRPESPRSLRRSPSTSSSIRAPPSSNTPSNNSVLGADGSRMSTPGKNADDTSLNRELWDIRRQISALKAREEHVAKELKARNALELGEPAPAQSPADPAERLKVLEGEILTLRSRLQSEVSRRQLVEESCEMERRRRKLAEGALDDARREYSQPLVMPAMMDAFEKIAQLTGDAMADAEEPMQQ